jgi:hypothetical protein
MLMVNGVMAIACFVGEEFHLILMKQRIISNFRQIKAMLMVNGVMAIACFVDKEFHLILMEQRII